MNKLQRNKRTVIRFRRWSRKAYASFCSLGKCVTIGCLSKGIADASLGKQSGGPVVRAAVRSNDSHESAEQDVRWCEDGGGMSLNPCEELLQVRASLSLQDAGCGSWLCGRQLLDKEQQRSDRCVVCVSFRPFYISRKC